MIADRPCLLAVADPMYHNSGDVSDREGYDFEQVKAIAKVQVMCGERAHGLIADCVFWQFATVLHVAGFTISG